MLAELRSAHGEMLEAIAQLERLTAQDVPDEAALAAARYRLGRSSGRRRTLADAACNALIPNVSAADAERLKALRDANVAMLAASSRHITRWGLRDVAADWTGYRTASAAMRQSLRDRVAEEQRLLYPLLERATP